MGKPTTGVLGAGLSCSSEGAQDGAGGSGGATEGAGGAEDGAGGEHDGVGVPQVCSGFGAGLAACLQAGIHVCTGCTSDATFAGGAKRTVTFFTRAGT